MLGAEKKAPSHAPAASAARPAGRGRLVAATVLEAVNLAERAICGAGVVDGLAAAEGLALAGQRAATRLRGSSHRGATAPPGSGGWVHHRLLPDQPAPQGPRVIELVAVGKGQTSTQLPIVQRSSFTADLELTDEGIGKQSGLDGSMVLCDGCHKLVSSNAMRSRSRSAI